MTKSERKIVKQAMNILEAESQSNDWLSQDEKSMLLWHGKTREAARNARDGIFHFLVCSELKMKVRA